MHKKRAVIVFIFFLTLFFGLLTRIFYFQICISGKLYKAASVQRTANSEIEKPRGNIVDRNFIPLTNREKKVSIVLKPLFLKDKEYEIKVICEILGLEYEKVRKEIGIKSEPFIFETDEEKKNRIVNLNIQGVSVISSLKRYGGSSVAKHVIGYLNKVDQVGEAGVEKFYENALNLNGKNNVGVITDAKKNLVQGLGYRIMAVEGKNKKLNLKLTIDYHIQKIVEATMDRNNITGAIVVEDVCSGDIMAIASKPDFDPNNVERYLYSPNNELFNKAVASYNIGSIFKIIDAAEAFESGLPPDYEYFCTGQIKIGDKEFKCSSKGKGGHGKIGIVKAFALSCNPYFINLGINAGSRKIIDMAKKFGLGNIVGIKEQGVDEAYGKLPAEHSYSDGDIANIAIGQGDILVTPVQAADIVATVANGGIKNRVNIVDSVVNDEGGKIRDIRRKEGKRIISGETSDRIKYMMEEVTITGTGVKANMDRYGGAGGKTGSAETGQYNNGNKVIHAWFVGYFPRVNTKYSISVFIEDGKNGGQVAAPIFAQIAEEIIKKGY